MTTTRRALPDTREEVLLRWPRLTAHLICKSLGYMTPLSAADAVLRFKREEPNYCEWYYDWAGKWRAREQSQKNRTFDETIVEVGRMALCQAISQRHHHKGYMAEFAHAIALVRHYNKTHQAPEFASWF